MLSDVNKLVDDIPFAVSAVPAVVGLKLLLICIALFTFSNCPELNTPIVFADVNVACFSSNSVCKSVIFVIVWAFTLIVGGLTVVSIVIPVPDVYVVDITGGIVVLITIPFPAVSLSVNLS